MTQLEMQNETLVNSDVLLQEYESKLEEAVDYMDNEDVTMGEKALVIGEALYNIRQHLSDKDWNQWRKNHPRYNKTSLYDMKRYYEITLSIPAGRNVGYTKMTSLFSLKDNLEDFMSKHDVINMSREQIRQAKKEYKGENANSSLHSEDSGKDATPVEKPKLYTEEQVKNKIKVAKMKFHSDLEKTVERQDEEITQLQEENQRLRNENRVLNERDVASLSDADKLYEHSKFYRTYADNHSGDICIGFDDYVEKRLEEARQEAVDKYKENEAYNAY